MMQIKPRVTNHRYPLGITQRLDGHPKWLIRCTHGLVPLLALFLVVMLKVYRYTIEMTTKMGVLSQGKPLWQPPI